MHRLILPGLVLAFSFLSLMIGAIPFSFGALSALDEQTLHLLIHSRFPRTLSLLVSGMSLASAGAIMQLMTANRFVTPTTGSTTEWAKLGLLITLLWVPQASVLTKTLFTLLFAFGGTLSFLLILRNIKLKEAAMVPLIGIIYGNIISSVTTYLGYRHDLIQSVQSWVQGNFALVLKGRYEVLFLSIPCLVLAVVYANRFTVISMGRDISHSLGVRYATTLQVGLVIVSVISSLVLVTVGVIPFVGLVIPNIVSLFKGDNLEKNILAIAFSGGLFLLICDIISRVVIHPFEIPISVTASIIGCILFITFLIYRRHHAA
ncbi:ABC transporter permease [Sphaerochaeta sp.]|jgi:iron complex transport system permease protein|uniref:ABC transporter permease n=1 Tax=Sphaerochaeta sp. TaxID=1972642 RepID=UPI002A35AC65|nr:iron chelate uptake ABC transporter family permease subunit [Sphaerochaeta sp.]MDX9985493.1 iron chelate uptake ABC transporter family permease subunit [Sphaerochaeta sp.]